MHRRTVLKQLGAGISLGAAHNLAILGQSGAPASGPKISHAVLNVLMNQTGFRPGADKMAVLQYVGQAPPDGPAASFRVVSADGGKPVFEGPLSAAQLDAASGDFVQQARFSTVTAPGSYYLEVAGVRSEPFTVSDQAYAPALRLAMRAFYGQRCGCAVDLGGGYQHPACHLAGAYHPSSGRSGAVANHGGWHDAGDYGRYVVNCGISTGTLLWAWELYPEQLHALALEIPESGGKLPDYLAEIRWNLEWMLSLQDPDGGVWHKQTSEHFCAFILPQDDHLTSYVIGTGAAPYKSTCATADLASVAAIAARCYQPYDAAFAQQCLAAARAAWTWAMAHPDVTFTNPAGVSTGAYGDKHCIDELLWASAELWRTTGEVVFEQAFLKGMEAAPGELAIAAPSWGSVGPMAYWTYVMGARQGSAGAKNRIRAATAKAAAELGARSDANGYGNTLAATDYIWGSNSVAGNQSLLLLIADHFSPDKRSVAAALGNLEYLLGRNCHEISWVTQVGTRPFQHPHHRPSVADRIAAPWPGLLSGGPNASGGDAVANTLPKMPPMRMWVDDQRAYSLNEVAINWNAPLVFLLAAANARSL